MDPIWLWVVAAVVCGIIEVLSVSFVFLMLGVGALAGAGATCGRVTSEPPTLNEVFLEITGRALRDEAA